VVLRITSPRAIVPRMRRHASARAIALFLPLAMACSGPALAGEPRTVESVDLGRYGGHWYEVARFPNPFQRRCTADVTATYEARPDGTIDVVNRCRVASGALVEAVGVARVTDPKTRAKLAVRFAPAFLSFLPFLWGDYWVLGLEPDYRWAVVGTPDREYLWILARTPDVADADYRAALSAAAAEGFDVGRTVRTQHGAQAAATAAAPR